MPKPKGLGESAAFDGGSEKADAGGCPNPPKVGFCDWVGFDASASAPWPDSAAGAFPEPTERLLGALGVSWPSCFAPNEKDCGEVTDDESVTVFGEFGANSKADLAGANVVRGAVAAELGNVVADGAGVGDSGGETVSEWVDDELAGGT